MRTAASAVTLRRFELRSDQAGRLKRGLARAHFAHLEVESTPACADCFVYRLTTPANSVRFDQAGAPARIKPVISPLEAIVAAHRSNRG